MIVLGASRHAKEVLQILRSNEIKVDYLLDNFSTTFHPYFDDYEIIRSFEDNRILINDNFILGLGGTNNRKMLFEKSIALGLIPMSVISNTAVIGMNYTKLGIGLNIMHFAFIADCVKIGNGTLINAYASIHHDVTIGDFCEISPKAVILGGAFVGDLTSIGTGAIVLPNIKIGVNSVIGAGSIVTKDVGDNEIWYGNPSKLMKSRI